MPIVRLWVHAIWATRNREPILVDDIRVKVFQHILENGAKKGLGMDRVNGHVDHVHALFLLPNDIPISKAMQLLKGESSFWINRNSLTKQRFEWQDDYYAISVSEDHLRNTCQYIDNQEEHHRLTSFLEEYNSITNELASEL